MSNHLQPKLLSIEELNQEKKKGEKFDSAIHLLFEAAPPLSDILWQRRPYRDYTHLICTAESYLLNELLPKSDSSIGDDAQDTIRIIINAHPRLGAPKAKLSVLSQSEQQANVAITSSDLALVLEKLAEYNASYEAIYGFRYVVFVNGRSRADLLPEFKQRLAMHPKVNRDSSYSVDEAVRKEQRTAFIAMISIAHDRLRKLDVNNQANL